MKQVLSILLLVMVFSACTNEIEEHVSEVSGPVDYTFTIKAEGRSVATRSLFPNVDEGSVNDLNVFIFDALNGQVVSFKYFTSAEVSNISIPMQISGTSGSRIFAFIANAGSALGSSVSNLSGLNSLKRQCLQEQTSCPVPVSRCRL